MIEETEIEYLTAAGMLNVPALRFREVAAVPHSGHWWLIHVPSGCSIMGLGWDSEAAAREGLVKVDSVSNRWLELDEEDRQRIDATLAAGDFGFAPLRAIVSDYAYEEKANGYG